MIHRLLRGLVTGMTLFGFVALSRPAAAQVGIPRLRFKAGVFRPSDSSLKSVSGDTWFKVGADLTLPFGLAFGGGSRLGVEYASTGSAHVTPITLISIFQPSAAVVKSPIYIGAGPGIWNLHAAGLSGSPLGLRIVGGADLGKRLFIEGQYDFVSKTHGISLNGLSLVGGIKF